MPSDHDPGGPVPFEAPHRAKSGLEPSVVSLDSIVGVLGGVVKCIRQELCNDSDQGVGPVGGDLDRLAMGGDHRGEEHRRCPQVTLLGHEHVDDLPVLIIGSVDVSPGSRYLHVGLVDKPTAAHTVAARLGRVHQDRRESLNPSEQGHMVDLDAPFGEEFLKIPIGQSVAQVPADSDQDDLRRKPESGESRFGLLDGANESLVLHADSLVQPRNRLEPLRFPASSCSMQQCQVSALHSCSLVCQWSRREPCCDRAGSRSTQQCPTNRSVNAVARGDRLGLLMVRKLVTKSRDLGTTKIYRMMVIGQCAWREHFRLTEPSKSPSKPPRPLEPTTSSSAPSLASMSILV